MRLGSGSFVRKRAQRNSTRMVDMREVDPMPSGEEFDLVNLRRCEAQREVSVLGKPQWEGRCTRGYDLPRRHRCD